MKQQLCAVHLKPGPSTDCSVPNLVGLFRGLAMLAGCKGCENARFGPSIVIWIDSGSRLLDLIESGDFPARSLEESRERRVQEIRSLCLNMRSLAPQWRDCITVDGSLLFSIQESGWRNERNR